MKKITALGICLAAGLAAQQRPLRPDAFEPPADWKGKAVLVELFTGSECPACVGADLALDGLIDVYPSKHLAVLEYHLPIPRPDPMTNPSAGERQGFYEIRDAPAVVVDGARLPPGDGTEKNDAAWLYGQCKKEIDGRLGQDPVVAIGATATLGKGGDRVNVKCEFSKIVEGAEFFMALVQDGERYTGANGVELHRMVVRDLGRLPAKPKLEPTISLEYLDAAADEYLTEFEATGGFVGFRFPARRHRIDRIDRTDRSGLRVVLFAQDRDTKKVHNAFVASVAAE